MKVKGISNGLHPGFLNPNSEMEKGARLSRALFSAPRGKPWVVRKSSRPADWMMSCEVRDAGRVPLRPGRACSQLRNSGLIEQESSEQRRQGQNDGRIGRTHRTQPKLRAERLGRVLVLHPQAGNQPYGKIGGHGGPFGGKRN